MINNIFKYTPVVQKEGKNGAVFVIPFGRPIKAVDQKELEKKMKNRRSALEARKRQKMKEEKLQENSLFLIFFYLVCLNIVPTRNCS